MAWCQPGDKPLSEPMLKIVINVSASKLVKQTDLEVMVLMSNYILKVYVAVITYPCLKFNSDLANVSL